MLFHRTSIEGLWIVEPELCTDERGFFARTWCEQAFSQQGLETRFVQCSISGNRTRGTLRGMHYQCAPDEETKLIRCTAGAIYDVALDLRAGSPTFGKWEACELSAENHRMFYIPRGFAHGFQSLVDDAEVSYQISTHWKPESARGVRWDDPAFRIRWPLPVSIISERDGAWPLWKGER